VTGCASRNSVLRSAVYRASLRPAAFTTTSMGQAERQRLYRATPCGVASGCNCWMGENVGQARANFGRVSELLLSAEFSWEYDVEFSHGFTINSTPWANASALASDTRRRRTK
jgi:hypothetical protein